MWAHELPILEAMFGEGAAVEIDPATMDEGYTDKVAPAMLIYNKQLIVKPVLKSSGKSN